LREWPVARAALLRTVLALPKGMRRYSLLLVALTACSQTVPQKPTARASRGLRADQHLDAAREHARRADELARWPEARRNDVGQFDDPNTGMWYRAWDQSEDHRRLAATHRGAAAQLHVAYEQACENIAPELARISPLQRYGHGGMDVVDGVVVFMPGGAITANRLLAELRCHRAWMMLQSNSGMDLCPLDLPGLRIQAHGDASGISVELRVADKALVPELQRRTARDLEVATQHGAH
jgi:hypothetical protein